MPPNGKVPRIWMFPLAAALAFAGCLAALTGASEPTAAAATPIPAEPTLQAQRLAALLTSWKCLAPATVDDYNTTARGGLRCSTLATLESSRVVVRSTGIPNHDFHSGPGCCAREQSYTWRFPLAPQNATGALTFAPERGPIAVAVNGVPIYGPEDGSGGDAVAASRGAYAETRERIWLGLCDAHSGPGGAVHYHADGNCIHWHPDATQGESWSDYAFEKVDGDAHSQILGWAFDGYPVYGSHGYGADGSVKEIRSSYRLKPGATGWNGIDDYVYVEGLGDLDACNGRWAATPEFPSGTYAYHSTLRNGEGSLGFPYFLLCYRGVPDTSNFARR